MIKLIDYLVNKPIEPSIVTLKKKNNNKKIKLNKLPYYHGINKRNPSIALEWHNSICSYNNNYYKLLSAADDNLLSLTKIFFSSREPRLKKLKKFEKWFITQKLQITDKRKVEDIKLNLDEFSLNIFRKRKHKKSVVRLKKMQTWMDRIQVSKGNVKHTNNTAIITLFIFNKEKHILIKKNLYYFKRMIKYFSKDQEYLLKYYMRQKHRKIYFLKKLYFNYLRRIKEKNILNLFELKIITMIRFKRIQKKTAFIHHWINKKQQYNPINFNALLYNQNKGINEPLLNLDNLNNISYFKTYLNYFKFIRLNKIRFEKRFLENLRKLTGQMYNKNIIFNFVNISKYYLNSYIYTKLVSLKLRDRRFNISEVLSLSLENIKVPLLKRRRLDINKSLLRINKMNHNIIFDLLKKRTSKGYWFEHLLFKYNNAKVNPLSWFGYNLIKKNELYLDNIKVMFSNKKLINLIKIKKIVPEIFWINTINNKNKIAYYLHKFKIMVLKSLNDLTLGGIRVQIRGRLTKRFKASRTLYMLKWIGGLRNINSSYKGLSTRLSRGYHLSNTEFQVVKSKRRIGAFGVKGWVSSL